MLNPSAAICVNTVSYESTIRPSKGPLHRPPAEEPMPQKAYLKIFLGYASGVGKSFRMLDEARRRWQRGQDVVVGATQPQVPPEAEALLRQLEVIPLKQLDHGTALDLDALIKRQPDVCFIDGLAYDNPPGARDKTRWEDVRELVHAGIKVVASINIQYIAELREQVEAITGKRVTQTVPISFIKRADEIEIVDAPPIEPIERSPEAETGVKKRQQQLSRLREMALLLAADVVDHQLNTYLESHGIKQHVSTVERILVCLTPQANAREMIETAQLVAQRFHGELIVAYVDQPGIQPSNRAAVDEKLALARAAGAEIKILQGQDPVEVILEFARARGITELFIGHSRRSGFWSRIRGGRTVKLIRRSRGIDVRIFPNER
jgi:two-component system, OmpR family, sensor histidine kinase KdpD